MLKLKWTSVTITTNKQANDMIRLIEELKPTVGAFDTETNGLHIILSRPFVYQFGFVHPNLKEGYTFAVDLEKQPNLAKAVIDWWQKFATSLTVYLGHNVKYDLHMMANINLPYNTENLSDTMFYIRYGHDAITEKNGGPPMGLKNYTAKFIDLSAKISEQELKVERSTIAKELNLKLKTRLKSCGVPPEKYGAQSYTLAVIQKMFKDPIFDMNDLPNNIKDVYSTWLNNDVPDYIRPQVLGLVESDFVPYNVLNRAILLKYAHQDIIYTLEIWFALKDVIIAREQTIGLDFENKLILPLWEMERVGFKTNKTYVAESRIKLKAYIIQRRQRLYDLASMELSVGQHALIKSLLQNYYEVDATSTSSEQLNLLKNQLIKAGDSPEVIEFIDIIQELRTLEKWYSTYIMRFLKDLRCIDRLYTTINQVGTVSGRVTSDFQQFPKDPIITIDGDELFHPRKMVVPTGDDYNAIVYLDYSQIELRFQAFYTILVGNPDVNLCRAYMPFNCIDRADRQYNYDSWADIQDWQKEWYLQENREQLWEPVDVHGATTQKATGLSPKDPSFKRLRSEIGKRVNFAKNYGAQFKKIKEMFPEKTDEEVRRIDNAYYEAFPGVKSYHNYCYLRADHFSYTENLFGVKYYNVSGHKLINMLVQGSSAYYLKWKIRELYDFCKTNNIKSRFQMNIHDELSWERHVSDFDVFFKFKEIMQHWPDTKIPIVAEMDVTTTTWSEKKGVEDLDALRLHLSS